MGCYFLLQGIFLTQGLNPSTLHWQGALYHRAIRETLYLPYPLQLLIICWLAAFEQGSSKVDCFLRGETSYSLLISSWLLLLDTWGL